jgi:murein DD-endopeptidase MepM/ murein hydrolase activator NlpD
VDPAVVGPGAPGDVRLLVVRHARPVREIRVRRRTLWRAATVSALVLWGLPLGALAGIAAQAREDRARLAEDVEQLTDRTARLSTTVAALEHSVGIAPGDSASATVPSSAVRAPAVARAAAADGWVDDLDRRVGAVRDAIRTRLRSLPLGTPIAARLSSGFGWRADPLGGGDVEWHPGLDLPAREGAPVRATADGVVEFAGWRNGYGLAVIVRHADGFSTLFGHLSAATVRAGDPVTRDALIGRVGNEGRSTGPHLHYEVRRWGKPIDPRAVRAPFAPPVLVRPPVLPPSAAPTLDR